MTEKRAILVICDGLRSDLLTPDLTPNLCRLAANGRRFMAHRSVFPSTTRTTSASIATGCHPAKHGLQGNAVALDEGEGLVPLTAGAPDFRDRLLKATGKTLRVPTLAERVENHGGNIVFSNVSPGAAYFQDPDGHGHVYHRSGSYGPGLAPITGSEHLDISHDAAGDTAMTTRFIAEVVRARKPRTAVMWQCEPDHTQHDRQLGSAEHRAVLAAADANAGRVADAVAELNAAGEDILLLIGSDHGHETVGRIIDLEAELIAAGFKRDRESHDCVVASQGLSAFIYLAPDARDRVAAILDWLPGVEGVGTIHAGDGLAALGQRTDGALAIAVDGAKSEAPNEFGVAGISDAFFNRFSTETKSGHGQHGGLGTNEQNPFLIAIGAGFDAGSAQTSASSAIDVAPTMLRHVGLGSDGMDGEALQTA